MPNVRTHFNMSNINNKRNKINGVACANVMLLNDKMEKRAPAGNVIHQTMKNVQCH